MTRLTDLYRKAEELDIRVIQFPMASLRAVSTPDNFIGIDPDKLEDREALQFFGGCFITLRAFFNISYAIGNGFLAAHDQRTVKAKRLNSKHGAVES
jgi:hypothetical protein